MNYNKVILAGNLTRDPELSYLPSNTAVADFGLAVNRKWKSKDGQQKEETCFVDCRAFGRQAEVIQKHLGKGRPILVEGRLKFESWEKDGRKNSKIRVIVERFEFLGEKQETVQPAAAPPPAQPSPPQQAPPDDFGDEDIPF